MVGSRPLRQGYGAPPTGTDRVGKKLISGHFPKTTWAELRRLSIEHETTSQDLLEEALADLFAKYRSRA